MKQKQIVVVDDDAEIVDLVTAFFKPKGYAVIAFSDAESALKECKSSGDQWDVVLSDLNLPVMSGVELTEKIKEINPSIQLILITTTKSSEVAVEAVEKGVYDFIVKPIHFPQLQISVDRALHLKNLRGDLHELRERVRSSSNYKSMVGKSPKFLAAISVASRVAKSKASIFINGESGTGKEVFAKFIHEESGRGADPFVAINCSAIPENLLESELFGHAKGSFTGAHDKKIGLFEEAKSGTLFLDEIGDLSLVLQAKLLRVLQEKKIRRVGENQFRDIDCRIISATHKDLALEIREGRFREDLFFRLNVIPILIPPLRDRQEDILPLADSFLKRYALENDSKAKVFSKDAIRFLLGNSWRGNVRELENTVERAVILSRSAEVTLENVVPLEMPTVFKNSDSEGNSGSRFSIDCESGLLGLDEVIHKYIEFAVALNDGARDRTAREIGVDRKTLYKRLKDAADLSH